MQGRSIGVPTSYAAHPASQAATPVFLSAAGGHTAHAPPVKPPSFVPEARRQANSGSIQSNSGSFVPLGRDLYPGVSSLSMGGQVKSAVAARAPRRAGSPGPQMSGPQRQSPSPKPKQRGPQAAPLVTRSGLAATSPRVAARPVNAPPPSAAGSAVSEAHSPDRSRVSQVTEPDRSTRVSQATELASEMPESEACGLPPKPTKAQVRQAPEVSLGAKDALEAERRELEEQRQVLEKKTKALDEKALQLAAEEARLNHKSNQLNERSNHERRQLKEDSEAQAAAFREQEDRLQQEIKQFEKKRREFTEGDNLRASELREQEDRLQLERKQFDKQRRELMQEQAEKSRQLDEREEHVIQREKQLDERQRQHLEACREHHVLRNFSTSPRGKENQEAVGPSCQSTIMRKEAEETKMGPKEIKSKVWAPETVKVPLAPTNWFNTPA